MKPAFQPHRPDHGADGRARGDLSRPWAPAGRDAAAVGDRHRRGRGAALRRRLGIDAGYASRCCARSRPRGWWRWHPTWRIGGCGSPPDSGRRGRAAELDRRSDAMVISMLESLDSAAAPAGGGDGRRRAAAARRRLTTIARPIRASADARGACSSTSRSSPLVSSAGFDPAASNPAGDAAPPQRAAAAGAFRGAAGGMRCAQDPGGLPPEVKRMWVAPEARRPRARTPAAGRARAHAKRGGATTIRLETNRALGRGGQDVPQRRLPGGGGVQLRGRTPITGSRSGFRATPRAGSRPGARRSRSSRAAGDATRSSRLRGAREPLPGGPAA